MTILECKRYFKRELADLYSDSETAFIYSFLVEKVVGFGLHHQRRFSDQELLQQDQETLEERLQELKTGKPYQQILGETEFYGLLFSVNEHVLIPRPETEELLEIAISTIRDQFAKDSQLKILDIGTGSGVIPIVLKKYFPNAQVQTMDISKEAIQVGKKNAEKHQLDIQFNQADYLSFSIQENFDILISNPPYIGKDEFNEIEFGVKNFEPNIALFSPTEDALLFYRKIAQDGFEHLKKEGLVFLEINQKLGAETLALFEAYSEAKLIQDLSGNDRFVVAKK